jgi:AcrR family transcriptional regulator
MKKRKLEAGEEASGLGRLPPGRHGLSREFVARNQRERLVSGMIAAVAEHGYNGATVARVAKAAGVSRRTFYIYFSSKEECYFDTYEQIAAHLREAMNAAGGEHADWSEKVRAGFTVMLETFAANPDLVCFCLIAPLTAGEEIAARYRLSIERLLAVLAAVLPPSPVTRQPSRAAEESLAGGIAALIIDKVKAGDGEGMIELLPGLLELALRPYLGHDEAIRVAGRGSHS